MCGIVLSDAMDHMSFFILCDNGTYVVNNSEPNVKHMMLQTNLNKTSAITTGELY